MMTEDLVRASVAWIEGAKKNKKERKRQEADARLIELLLPGRFDLGVTRGLWLPGALRCALLDGREPVAAESHPGRLAELHGLLTGRLPEEHPLRTHVPLAAAGPPMWVLGLGAGSARAAGRLGGMRLERGPAAQRVGLSSHRPRRSNRRKFFLPMRRTNCYLLRTRPPLTRDQNIFGFQHTSIITGI